MPVFFISVDISEANILLEFESTTLPENPSNGPLKDQFLQRLLLEFYFLFDIIKYWRD